MTPTTIQLTTVINQLLKAQLYINISLYNPLIYSIHTQHIQEARRAFIFTSKCSLEVVAMNMPLEVSAVKMVYHKKL